jgi:hypothetical protein
VRLRAEAAEDIAMQAPSHPKPEGPRRPLPSKPEARAADAAPWKPHVVGLTRQEIRDIVIDVIG